ncbi:Ig-like domain-containing protein [Bradyrhizobium sp. HKCCYLS20291]|uniref:Ig-like domain-containing protein n=1 Tax=Bradyrhizobium sp. HKCCYLS20291 TaxID=3420766 RepID=UPI003EBCE40E
MMVISGKRCSMVLVRSGGPTFTAQVLEPPSHGRAVVRGLRVTYVSHPNYIGEDHFVYAWKGLDMINRPRTSTVEMRVQVSQKL